MPSRPVSRSAARPTVLWGCGRGRLGAGVRSQTTAWVFARPRVGPGAYSLSQQGGSLEGHPANLGEVCASAAVGWGGVSSASKSTEFAESIESIEST